MDAGANTSDRRRYRRGRTGRTGRTSRTQRGWNTRTHAVGTGSLQTLVCTETTANACAGAPITPTSIGLPVLPVLQAPVMPSRTACAPRPCPPACYAIAPKARRRKRPFIFHLSSLIIGVTKKPRPEDLLSLSRTRCKK